MMRRIIRQHLRKAVLVTTKGGDTFRGVLFDADRDALIIRNATALDPRQATDPVAVDGEVLLLRVDVAYIQFV